MIEQIRNEWKRHAVQTSRVKRAIAALLTAALVGIHPAMSGSVAADDKPENAPITPCPLEIHDLDLKTADGKSFDLRQYATGKQLVIVCFVAGWCPNSIRNGHIIQRLYRKFAERGLGAIAVMEYSNPDEVRIFVNRIGIEYPVLVETEKQSARKKSLHYLYRHSLGDKRKWGTPFYIIFDPRQTRDLGPGAPLIHHPYTVAGEIVESEAESFLESHLEDHR